PSSQSVSPWHAAGTVVLVVDDAGAVVVVTVVELAAGAVLVVVVAPGSIVVVVVEEDGGTVVVVVAPEHRLRSSGASTRIGTTALSAPSKLPMGVSSAGRFSTTPFVPTCAALPVPKARATPGCSERSRAWPSS